MAATLTLRMTHVGRSRCATKASTIWMLGRAAACGDLNAAAIAEVWRRGSVVSSWLLDLTAMALVEDPQLSNYSGFVQDSGEGRWTIMAALEEAVPVEVLSAALYTRFRSRQEHTFAEKILSAMRQNFCGRIEKKVEAAANPRS